MFELHITCTKDIEKLSIDFSDGTSMVQTKSEKPHAKREPHEPRDWDSYNQKPEKQEIIKPPELPDLNREPKIDEHLNNLDF